MIKFFGKLYYWYWHDYRCRLEPWTFEWRRYTKKWWWVILIKVGLLAAACISLLLFFAFPLWAKIVIIIVGVILIAFYSWLLLHLGGFSLWVINRLRRQAK